MRPKKKQIRKTRSELYLLNKKFMGDEPSLASDTILDLNSAQVGKCLTWYGYMCDRDEAREYLIDYLTSVNSFEYIEKVNKISDKLLPLTAAWMSRILIHNKFSSSIWKSRIHRYIDEALKVSSAKITQEETDELKLVKPEVEKTKELGSIKAWTIIEEVQSFDLNVLRYNMFERLQGSNLSKADCDFCCEVLSAYTEKTISDYEYLIKEKATKKTKKEIAAFSAHMAKIIADLESFAGIKKAMRKPRKKKTVTPDKLLKHFKFCAHDPELKVASVQPEKILTAKELWTYNVRYGVITVYRSKEDGFLSIDRMSITQYDESTSFAKTVGHRKAEAVKNVINGTKAAVKKSFNELKGKDREVNPRCNENVLLLRVF